ncbi:MAG: hypothetical protein DRI77_10430 [Chloroflexi bacterium]|nr:MAG: hypothetical protein DRI77_10430 [Chloroflexota bacterium]
MSKIILTLDEASGRDHAGGKGYALARLRQAGFPVPPGFVVTAAALDENEGEMLPSLAAAICDAYRALGKGAVAVRSSALAEDGDAASFAGQYETFLNVAGCDALLTAVRRCWVSLRNERGLAYRRHLGRDESVPAMAVVVQRMVPAAQSGVAFTLDPVSGQGDVVIVEAVAGTGESLVSGQVAPDRYIVRREDAPLEIAGGLLDEERLSAVVNLARQVEAWAAQPQDVEWALDEAGQVYLLQARPITVVPTRNQAFQKKPGFYWTRDNVGEVLPDPVTPLSWSVLEPLGNRAFAGLLRRLGISDYPDEGLFARFYGWVYFNQTLFQGMMSHFYPSRAGWRAAPRLALTALRALLLLRRLPAESERVVNAILEHRRAEKDLVFWRGLGAETMQVHLAVTVMAELLYQTLDNLLARWADGTTTAAALTTGLGEMRSAEAGQSLADLAEQARRDESLRALVLTTDSQALPARLAETEVGRAFWTRIEAFLAEHGHSAAQEFELAAPRWRDDPIIILSALQASVRASENSAADPGRIRRETVAQVEKRLNLPQRVIFRRLLHLAQMFTATRENLKYHFVIAHSRLRDLYLALAGQCVAAGQLSEPDDIFFLTADQVVELTEGKLAVSAIVSERRRAWKVERETAPPRAFEQMGDGRLRPVSLHAETGGDGAQLLRGFAASPGSYTGRARVLRSPTDGDGIEPGEVLVAPATSPGWAPLFLTAGALVTEIGGVLSHGAIIAREYGLPAVLNVAGATRHIRSGQLVHVDGYRGTVQLLEEAA